MQPVVNLHMAFVTDPDREDRAIAALFCLQVSILPVRWLSELVHVSKISRSGKIFVTNRYCIDWDLLASTGLDGDTTFQKAFEEINCELSEADGRISSCLEKPGSTNR